MSNKGLGVDFQGSTSGTINWADGDADPKWIEFTIEDDGTAEPTESYELSLQNPAGATVGAQGTINVLLLDGAGVNNAPNAIAGGSQTVTSGAQVTLDGSGSNDPDNDALTYQWTQISGDAVTLSNAATATASFTAPTVTSDRLLRFRLTVSDGQLQSSATVSVTVQRAGGGGGLNNRGGGGGSAGWLVLLGLLVAARRKLLA